MTQTQTQRKQTVGSVRAPKARTYAEQLRREMGRNKVANDAVELSVRAQALRSGVVIAELANCPRAFALDLYVVPVKEVEQINSHRFVAEASDIGLGARRWPAMIALVARNGAALLFQQGRPIMRGSELEAGIYEHGAPSDSFYATLTLYND